MDPSLPLHRPEREGLRRQGRHHLQGRLRRRGLGARPFAREQYIEKFRTLCEGIVSEQEQERFLAAVQDLENLDDLAALNIELEVDVLAKAPTVGEGLF